MALMETKIIQVENSPSTINECNAEWGYFGWSVLNVQVTHSQDTRTYTKTWSDYVTGDKTVETTTINYATITYQRDKHISCYRQLVELESDYVNLLEELSATHVASTPSFSRIVKAFRLIDWIISIGGLFLNILPGVIYFFYRYNRLKNNPDLKSDFFKAQIADLEARRDGIIRKAESILEQA